MAGGGEADGGVHATGSASPTVVRGEAGAGVRASGCASPTRGFTNFLQNYQLQNHQLVHPKKQLVTYAFYALITLTLLHYLLLYPAPAPEKAVVVPRVQEGVETVVAAQMTAGEQLPPSLPSHLGQQGDGLLVNPRAIVGHR